MLRSTKWRYPLWYYGMILLTALSTGAGVYFKGDRVQTDAQVDRVILGLLVTAFFALATWSFRQLTKEIRGISRGLRALFGLEAELHPEHSARIMAVFQRVIEGREYRDGD